MLICLYLPLYVVLICLYITLNVGNEIFGIYIVFAFGFNMVLYFIT